MRSLSIGLFWGWKTIAERNSGAAELFMNRAAPGEFQDSTGEKHSFGCSLHQHGSLRRQIFPMSDVSPSCTT